eukprot:TRINITY_DN53382_c0_g1_i1.p1 TRINITY_DN53382_c0_g1~~TRINITY_DN53382_c0_g1_i1.p1  ORF type:complete len:104 (+),score=7.57 TRINITY_DN53382_c0_g1_i1:2-313(+)
MRALHQQTSKLGKAYAGYTFIKFVGAAALLLVVGMREKKAIEDYYTFNRCVQCANAAVHHPTTLYEYGICSVRYGYPPTLNPEEIGRAVQQECRDRSRMPSSA